LIKVDFGGQKVDKKDQLPNFKGRACNLDFPALNESNFAAFITACQLFEPEKSVEVDFRGQKVDKKSIFDPKFDLKSRKSIISIVSST